MIIIVTYYQYMDYDTQWLWLYDGYNCHSTLWHGDNNYDKNEGESDEDHGYSER